MAQCSASDYNSFANILDEHFSIASRLLKDYCKFKKTLAHVEYLDASPQDWIIRLLNGSSITTNSNDNTTANEAVPHIELKEYTEALPPINFTINKSSRIYFSKITPTYRMESNCRGVAFIANIINFRNANVDPRDGAVIDRNN